MTLSELFEAVQEFIILMKMPYLHDELSFVSDKEYNADPDEDSDEDSNVGSMFNNSDNNYIESDYDSETQ